MLYIWRCPKCSRYLTQIEITSKDVNITQRTICPRCKSENKIILNINTVIISCGFSRKFDSNLKRIPENQAPNIQISPVEKSRIDIYSIAEMEIANNKKDDN
jgi:phage FluMu protein Com